MINLKSVLKYCCEDITKIENFNEAVNDEKHMWDCHHRLETHNEDGTLREEFITKTELIEKDLYWKRPASELIFLGQYEHLSLHHKGQKIPDEQKEKISKTLTGRKMPEDIKQKISDTLSKKRAVYVEIIPTGIIMTTKQAALYFEYCSSGKLKQYIKQYGRIKGVPCRLIEN